MIRLAILLLLIPCAASAQAIIARPAAEDCSLARLGPDGEVIVDWPCVDVYAAKTDWQDARLISMAIVMKAIHEGRAK